MKFAGLDKHWKQIDWKRIVDFCRTNIRYISSGVVVVILVIVLAVTTQGQNGKRETDASKQEDGQKPAQEQEQGQAQNQKEDTENPPETVFVENTIPEIDTLISSYYGAYAAGDTAALETYATPISELEKKYIAVMSQYVAGYENVECYVEEGLSAGEYAVIAVADTKYENVGSAAAGLELFYVRQNESGAYYIDNLYSTFNTANQELEQDSQIAAFIAAYEEREDVLQLVQEVQARFEEDLASDEGLKTMAEVTIPEALTNWVAQVVAEAEGTTDTSQNTDQTTDPTQDQTTGETADPAQPGDGTTDTSQTTEPANPGQTAPVSETVYATANVNIRREASETSEQVGSAVAGQSFTRTANANGWSQIEYNGGTAYIKSDYLSTEAPAENTGTGSGVNWVNPGTVVTLNSAMNVRKSMSETSEKLGTAKIGEKVTVVLSYKEGWTKVEWNGKTGYILTELLLNN